MSIVYEGFGNILTHPAQTITCPVNTVSVMGAGLALAMRNRIRGLNDYYKGLCQLGKLSLGICAVYQDPLKDQQILLFPTKGHWKDDSLAENIASGLIYLTTHLEELKIHELAIPPLGCGLGKLDYTKDVKPLLEQYLEPLAIPVYILHRQLK
jgi:O-acetyl-ADP-ribose deacetylase (regulator of RNase III)